MGRPAHYFCGMEAPRHYHWHDHSDNQRLVAEAAGVLRIREFDLFRLAWERYRGGRPDDRTLEQFFVPYMFRRSLPPWVRQFCRDVLTQEKEGRLDPARFGADCVARRETPVSPGHLFLALVLAAAILLYPLVVQPASDSRKDAGLICETGPGMRFFAGLAQALSDRPLTACPPPGGPSQFD